MESNICAFSDTFDKFAAISADNRLKVWDTTSNKLLHQYAQSAHLNLAYTCLSWGPSASHSGSKTPKKGKKASQQSRQLIALGTNQGTILCWDLIKSEIAQQFGSSSGAREDSSSRINDICFHPVHGSSIFVAREDDPNVTEYDLQSKEELRKWRAYSPSQSSGVQLIRITADGAIAITASSGESSLIKVWDLSSLKPIAKFSGHPSQVHQLISTSDLQFLISAAHHHRFVNIWKLPSTGKASTMSDEDQDEDETTGVSSEVAKTLICTDAPAQVAVNQARIRQQTSHLDLSASGDLSRRYHILAVARRKVSLWSWAPIDDQVLSEKAHKGQPKKKKTLAHVGDVMIPADDDTSVILCAGFSDSDRVIVARGSLVKPTFERVVYVSSDDGETISKRTTLESLKDSNVLISDSKQQQKSAAKAAKDVVVPSAAEANKIATPIDYKTIGKSPAELTALAESGPSMQDRLEALDGHRSKEDKVGGGLAKGAMPKANSLQTVLLQALKTDDQQLLETCLDVSDPVIIHNTVSRLPTNKVMPFLQIVVNKFQTNPNRGAQLVPWIRAVLVLHTSYLMTVPNIQGDGVLSGLYQTVDDRLVVFKKLLKLSGRLDLVLSQVSSKEKSQALGLSNVAKHATQRYSEDDILDEGESSEEDDDDDAEDNEEEDEESEDDDEDDDDLMY